MFNQNQNIDYKAEWEIAKNNYLSQPLIYSNGDVKRKVLIAEDDLISYLYLYRIFMQSNISTIHAINGVQAVEIAKNDPDIDLVLMDIRMPLMDGIEATKQIKQIRPTLPIIAQTAYLYIDDEMKIKEIGCDDYLIKPIEIMKVKLLLYKYFKIFSSHI